MDHLEEARDLLDEAEKDVAEHGPGGSSACRDVTELAVAHALVDAAETLRDIRAALQTLAAPVDQSGHYAPPAYLVRVEGQS